MPVSRLSIFKRSNGFWYILFNDEGRVRWKSTSCTLKSDALKRLTEFEKLLREKPKNKTLPAFCQDFTTFAHANYARATVDIFSLCLKHLRAIAGDCQLRALTPEHIDRYKTQRLGEVSPVSVNVELRALRSAFNTAMRWKFIDANPFANIRLVKTPDAVPSFLSKTEFQRLLSVVPEAWLRDIMTFAVLTGMRRGEIVNVRWKDVDLERRTVRIEGKPDFVVKCGKVRTVPLNNVLVQFLQSKAGRSACEYVFSLNGERIAGDYLSHKFKSSITDAGLSEKLHFHSLRHTFATWLVQDGVSIYEVQKLLGHSSVAVTQIYSHLAASELHETVNRIVLN